MKKENCCSDVKTKVEYTMATESCCGGEESNQDNSSCCNSGNESQSSSSCCSSDTASTQSASSCGCGSSIKEEIIENKEVDYNITIDGKEVHVTDASKNLVEIAKTAGISIPAPCFLAKKKNGCCMGCVVESDGKQNYACGTRPTEGMNVVVNRDDLKAIRKERLLRYQAAIKSGNHLGCEK